MPIPHDIVTPGRLVYSDEVDEVVVPGSQGELGILPHHAPLLTTLGLGELRIRKGGSEESFAIIGGFLQVRPDRAVVMAETADMAAEIDLERAEEARRGAERAPEAGAARAGPPSSPPCCASASPRAVPREGGGHARDRGPARAPLPLGVRVRAGRPR